MFFSLSSLSQKKKMKLVHNETTTLAIGAAYTSAVMPCGSGFTLRVYSDQSSASSGLAVRHTLVDGTVMATETFTYTTGSIRKLEVNSRATHFQVVYTNNGSTAQTIFQLSMLTNDDDE